MNFIPARVVQGESGLGLQMEGAAGAFVLPGGPRGNDLDGWRNKTLTLGIRPEQITQAGGEQHPENSYNTSCKIEMIEPTGPDTLAFIKLNDTKVVCRIHPSTGARPGEALALAFDMTNAVFFDPQTEQRVG
jgi:multiple sugar transport system ATP-binding protein